MEGKPEQMCENCIHFELITDQTGECDCQQQIRTYVESDEYCINHVLKTETDELP